MIPKKIHYCWFGGNPLPEEAQMCIDSWKKYCHGYEIIEWNERNYDICKCEYIKEAAAMGKWAFVSDYARFDILFQYGGLYFDTDVELISNIDDLAEKGPFTGIEDASGYSGNLIYKVNPGLCLAAEPGMKVFSDILCYYNSEHFILQNGEINKKTVLDYTTEVLVKYGYLPQNCMQQIGGLNIYPADFFCPMNYITGEILITPNTRSIHHYNMSWKSPYEVFLKKAERKCIKLQGAKKGIILYKLLTLPVRAVHKTYSILKRRK